VDCGTVVMSYDLDRLTATLADCYRVERELGRGGTDGASNIMDLCLILVG
jgi:hypothetical protein